MHKMIDVRWFLRICNIETFLAVVQLIVHDGSKAKKGVDQNLAE